MINLWKIEGYASKDEVMLKDGEYIKITIPVYQGRNEDAIWLDVMCNREVQDTIPPIKKGVRILASGRLRQTRGGNKGQYLNTTLWANTVEVLYNEGDEEAAKEDRQAQQADSKNGRSRRK